MPSVTLQETRGALCFALDTSVTYTNPDGTTTMTKDPSIKQVPAVTTLLAVGCKRKIVIYVWKDGQLQTPPKEVPLPHSPRAMAFPSPKVIAMAYTATEHALFYLDTMSVADIVLPTALHPSTSSGLTGAMGMGMNAISGLGGYMTLGLGAKSKPSVIKTADGEFTIPKENSSLFLGVDGKPSRNLGIEWPGTPEEIAFTKPYLVSILPAIAQATNASQVSTSAILQVRSSLSFSVSQQLYYPFAPLNLSKPANNVQYNFRVLSSSPNAVFLTSAPNDRYTLGAEGTVLWMLTMKPWNTQLDELVKDCKYTDALMLLESIDDSALTDKAKRHAHISALHGAALLAQKQYRPAIDVFLKLDLNPAKVVSMFPVEVSGRLAQPQSSWIGLFGEEAPKETAATSLLNDVTATEGSADVVSVVQDSSTASPSVSVQAVASQEKPDTNSKDYRDSIDGLLEYLSDNRRKITGALAALNIASSQDVKISRLSEVSVGEILALPDAAPGALTPEQLFRFAQIVYTALFKAYLVVRPGLIGSLCRIDNWCEVSEVENELRARGKFTDLMYLYQGKKMHDEALRLLKDLGEKETDKDEKLDPTVTYLQKLGPEYLALIFDGAKWVLSHDYDKGFQIFTSEEHDLPRDDVANFLEDIDPRLSIRYVEYLIDERKESSGDFHDRLGELYLHCALDPKLSPDDRDKSAQRLITFLETSTHYHPDRILASLPGDKLLEARAILLGRLGEHKAALSIYVYQMSNFSKAEEYCKMVHLANPDQRGIFMMLLKLYLRPENLRTSDPTSPKIPYLRPALDLISRHSPRLDAVETLQLLPPLVTASDVSEYLCEALRTPRVHVRIEREIWKAHTEQVSRNLVAYESRRVKITDTRL
ncbi:SubName: Full=Related to Vam6/Vps39-like protein involved in vacuolar morphogenesis {ECO:0000313/EMBL:CCA68795.1} [Serendipita indica DSM 11827]|nr:SubName: Full=Related to Vam6/Vps39-like protein involved in vacuolar morphogenesis {ECO:0000313/EMBL:CCA68795.1} [Serendipita indica DSM 11827]